MRLCCANPYAMETQSTVPETFSLSGDYQHRIVQLLRIARHTSRAAQASADRHMQDALTELEDALSAHIVGLENAKQDDIAEAEFTGELERERQANHPLRAG
jgi:hypothetical protein